MALSEVALDKALAREGEKPNGKSSKEKEAALRAIFAKVPEDSLSQCENCENWAPDSYTFCPFCGAVFTEDGDGNSPGEIPEEAAKPKPKGRAAPAEEKPKAAAKARPAPLAVVPPPAEEPTGAGAAAEVLSVTLANGTSVVGAKLRKMATALEEATKKILDALSDFKTRGYDLGVMLSEVHAEELWKAKGYKHFKAYVETELSMPYRTAWGLMESTKVATRAEFAKLGIKKLELIARAPEEDREEMKRRAAGRSKKQVERDVRAAQDAKGTKSARGRKPSDKVSFVLRVDAKPADAKLLDERDRAGKNPKVGMSASLDLGDGAALTVTIVHNRSGEAALRFRFSRPE